MPVVVPGNGDDPVIVPGGGSNSDDNTAFDLIDLDRLRNDSQFKDIDGNDLTIVVIDTGVDATHPSLSDNFTGFIDFTQTDAANPTLITDPSQTYDISTDGHGTHITGTIGATDLKIGMAPGVNFISLQVFDEATETRDEVRSEVIERALQWVLNNREQYDITAVNLSLAEPPGVYYTNASQATEHPFYDEVTALEAAGITVVAAAGNSYETIERQNLPAPAIFSTLAVGAVWSDDRPLADASDLQEPGADKIAYFSQRLDADNMIFAPGVRVESTLPDNGLGELTGTSFAASHITGAVALVQDAALEFGGQVLDPAAVAEILRSTADVLYDGLNQDDTVRNTFENYPRLNIYNAIIEIQQRGYAEMAQYGASYSDLIVGFGYDPERLAQHYREAGSSEGRSRDNFDEVSYLASNTDLFASIGLDATQLAIDYIERGYDLGRPLDNFDEIEYLASYPDLIDAFGYDPTAATFHYVQYGYSEGRAIALFKADEYIASYGDLIRGYGYDLQGAKLHYINYGENEGRSDFFDATAYLNRYPDLQAGFGSDLTAATKHYIEYGFSEGRTWF